MTAGKGDVMSYRILIVDDEESIRYTFSEFLLDQNYQVDTAESLIVAAAMVGDIEYDAVFLDIMLGRDNGINLLKVMQEQVPNCPVIMVTGAPEISTAAKAVRYGAFDYLTKPVSQEDLLLYAKRATDYKETLDQNERFQKRMAAVFQGIQDGIMVFDSNFTLIDINQAAINILSLNNDYVGKPLAAVIEESGNEILKALKESIVERVEGELYRVEVKDGPGKTHILGACLSPLTTSTGKDNDFVLTLQNQSLPVKEIPVN